LLPDPHQEESHVQGVILTRERQLVERRGDEMFQDIDALFLQVIDDLVSLLCKTEDRGTGDVLRRVRETITHTLHEFQLLIRSAVALPVAAHGGGGGVFEGFFCY
jgi:hypothetical protein